MGTVITQSAQLNLLRALNFIAQVNNSMTGSFYRALILVVHGQQKR